MAYDEKGKEHIDAQIELEQRLSATLMRFHEDYMDAGLERLEIHESCALVNILIEHANLIMKDLPIRDRKEVLLTVLGRHADHFLRDVSI